MVCAESGVRTCWKIPPACSVVLSWGDRSLVTPQLVYSGVGRLLLRFGIHRILSRRDLLASIWPPFLILFSHLLWTSKDILTSRAD